MTLAELNSMDRDRFVEAIGWVFEHSPWVAERAWAHKPFPSRKALHAAMVVEVERAHPVAQLALLCAHPDLGTRASISPASKGEQAGAGLDRLTSEEFERLHRLNSAYRNQFGFPFLYAVKGSTKYDILQALERRLAASPEEELREALRQVYRIAEYRLRDAVQ
ncbi:MAG: 2-oxo-4-hydroxy-4-carboxy-5-ureidoimidazoline decarboxylase [Acidobacteriia bacterium]|nr:2-oxo-4-hydroxy-4-carboxy-5-ureidoimidazoline decarboxylase [Terriglobia bacterium]